ncbi:MAG: polysaccharide deacetylase family protein [Spirochaetes bacterium]|nr:polysaccharide deacetylase family protein [Spirochaetota bacterium]
MLKKSIFLLLLLSFLLSACQSINQNSVDSNLPPSVVIFSFDDGPNAQGDTTARLLDVLKKYEIRAMFALLGENARAHPDLVRRIYNEGHIIINHGYFDKWVIRMGEDEFRNNIIMGEKAISYALGKELNPRLFRPHGGFYMPKHERIWQEAGYTMIPVNIRVHDATSTERDKNRVITRIIERTEKQGGGIILLHDSRGSHIRKKRELAKNPEGAFNRSWIPAAVEEIIIALLDKGFKLQGSLDSVIKIK